jgi:hypothetical protein
MYVLTPIEWTIWERVRAKADAMSWYWCDPDGDGVHVADALPDECPLATHLWGWSDRVWHRWRIDPLAAVAQTLARADNPTASGSPAGPLLVGSRLESVEERPPGSVPADVTMVETASWPNDDWRVGVAGKFRDRAVSLLEVNSPVKLTFLAVKGKT